MTDQGNQDYQGLRQDFRDVSSSLSKVGERLAALEATRKGWADNQEQVLSRLERLSGDFNAFKVDVTDKIATLRTDAKHWGKISGRMAGMGSGAVAAIVTTVVGGWILAQLLVKAVP